MQGVQEDIAVKVIQLDGDQMSDELQREITVLKGLTHPNIVKYFRTLKDIQYLYVRLSSVSR